MKEVGSWVLTLIIIANVSLLLVYLSIMFLNFITRDKEIEDK